MFGIASALQKLGSTLHILLANVLLVEEGWIEAVGRRLQAVRTLSENFFTVQLLGHSLTHSEVACFSPLMLKQI